LPLSSPAHTTARHNLYPSLYHLLPSVLYITLFHPLVSTPLLCTYPRYNHRFIIFTPLKTLSCTIERLFYYDYLILTTPRFWLYILRLNAYLHLPHFSSTLRLWRSILAHSLPHLVNAGICIPVMKHMFKTLSLCSSCAGWHHASCEFASLDIIKCPLGRYHFVPTKHYPNIDRVWHDFPEQSPRSLEHQQ